MDSQEQLQHLGALMAEVTTATAAVEEGLDEEARLELQLACAASTTLLRSTQNLTSTRQ